MAKITKDYSVPRGVKLGQAFIQDSGVAQYLDGAQMQYTVLVKTRTNGFFNETLAYFDTLEDAKLFVDAKNALTATRAPAAAYEPTREELEAFIRRAGFTHGWENLESAARRIAERACIELRRPSAL